MKAIKTILLIGITFLLWQCKPTVHYIGQSYEASNSVQIFYDENKINTDYEIIGQAIAEGRNLEEVKAVLVERAKLEGADAVLIKDLGRETFAINGSGGVATTNQISASFLKY